MGLGSLIVANGTPENAEVLGDAGILYKENDVEELARRLQEIADCPGMYAPLRNAAFERGRAEYSWDAVVTRYEQLFDEMARPRRRRRSVNGAGK
jgi:glycosyltransferase involved in cell wall biosynthesis